MFDRASTRRARPSPAPQRRCLAIARQGWSPADGESRRPVLPSRQVGVANQDRAFLLAQVDRRADPHARGAAPLWRLANPPPELPSGIAAWERAAARLSHLLLYALMIALPVTGWIVNSASNVPFRIFWLVPLPAIVAPDEPTADFVAEVHGGLAALLALVLAAHIGAALWHHFVKRDTVLERMLPRRAP